MMRKMRMKSSAIYWKNEPRVFLFWIWTEPAQGQPKSWDFGYEESPVFAAKGCTEPEEKDSEIAGYRFWFGKFLVGGERARG